MTKTAEQIARYLCSTAKRRAFEKGLEFTIKHSDLHIPETCPIRGTTFKFNTGKLHPDNYSLDRKDSSKGYVPGNVFVISWLANNIKSNLSLEELHRLLKYMET